MEEGVPPTYIDDTNSWAVITWAAKNGNIKLMKRILEVGGSDPYHKYKSGEPAGEDDEKPEYDETTLVTNTPLMWASYGGHLRMVWLLLIDGYSPDDTDKMGNTCLHLAASSGYDHILQCLVDDGANPFTSNTYKNRPIDVASTPSCRNILSAAMERYAALDMDSRRAMHGENLTMVNDDVARLTDAVAAAIKVESPRAFRNVMDLPGTIQTLSEVIGASEEGGLDDEQIAEGSRLLVKLQRTAELMRTHLQYGRDLIMRSQSEFLIFTCLERLKHVDCAVDANEQDMMKLKQFIQKGQAVQASDELVNVAVATLRRLEAELEMSRAILAVPQVKVPIEDPPEGYWTEDDTGKITETEEFPLPPADGGGEYIWEHSTAYMKLAASIDRLRDCTDGAEALGANMDVI
ncbi:Ush1g, partial [Symbiodinium microadriaticum]